MEYIFLDLTVESFDQTFTTPSHCSICNKCTAVIMLEPFIKLLKGEA